MNMRRMFRVGVGLMAGVSLLLMTRCQSKDNDVQPVVPVSYVALYNASPNAPDLNIIVDDRQINNHPFGYADYTGYLAFYTGQRHITFGPFGASNVVVDTTVNLVDKKAYSIFVVDDYNKASVLVLNDSAATPETGKAVIRLVNLSPDAGTVHLNVKDQSELGSGEAFKNASAFLEVDAKTTSFQISSDGTTPVTLDVPDVSIQSGGFYTVVVRGYKTPPTGNKNMLSAEVI